MYLRVHISLRYFRQFIFVAFSPFSTSLDHQHAPPLHTPLLAFAHACALRKVSIASYPFLSTIHAFLRCNHPPLLQSLLCIPPSARIQLLYIAPFVKSNNIAIRSISSTSVLHNSSVIVVFLFDVKSHPPVFFCSIYCLSEHNHQSSLRRNKSPTLASPHPINVTRIEICPHIRMHILLPCCCKQKLLLIYVPLRQAGHQSLLLLSFATVNCNKLSKSTSANLYFHATVLSVSA